MYFIYIALHWHFFRKARQLSVHNILICFHLFPDSCWPKMTKRRLLWMQTAKRPSTFSAGATSRCFSCEHLHSLGSVLQVGPRHTNSFNISDSGTWLWEGEGTTRTRKIVQHLQRARRNYFRLVHGSRTLTMSEILQLSKVSEPMDGIYWNKFPATNGLENNRSQGLGTSMDQ